MTRVILRGTTHYRHLVDRIARQRLQERRRMNQFDCKHLVNKSFQRFPKLLNIHKWTSFRNGRWMNIALLTETSPNVAVGIGLSRLNRMLVILKEFGDGCNRQFRLQRWFFCCVLIDVGWWVPISSIQYILRTWIIRNILNQGFGGIRHADSPYALMVAR